jgi:predicted hydrocarbon binding protein/predicted amino acid-binding ACT domain protein
LREYRSPVLKAYMPGRRILEFKILLRNVPGAISEVSQILYGYRVNILSGYQEARDERFHWVFIADLSEAGIDPIRLLEEIKKLGKVIAVEYSEPEIDHLIIDDLYFPLMVQGERSLILRSGTFNEMMRALRDILGRDAGDIIIYQLGARAGADKMRHLKEYYKGFESRDLLKIALKERCAKGWCIAEIQRFDEDLCKAEVRAEGLFECLEAAAGEADRRGSQFFRGYLAGLLTSLWGKRISVDEVECISKRGTACIFKAYPGTA